MHHRQCPGRHCRRDQQLLGSCSSLRGERLVVMGVPLDAILKGDCKPAVVIQNTRIVQAWDAYKMSS